MAFTTPSKPTRLPNRISPIPGNTAAKPLSGKDFLKHVAAGVSPNVNVEIVFGKGKGDKPGGITPETEKVPPGRGGGGRGTGRPVRPGKSDGNTIFQKDEPNLGNNSFSSGVKSGTLVDVFEENSCSSYSSLFIQSGSFLPVSNEISTFRSIIEEQLYFMFMTSIQQKVNVRSENDFTKSDFYTYISRLSAALQIYYMIDSIVAYDSASSRTNIGLMHLRRKLDANILSEQADLRLTLLKCPIPKNMIKFISYMYQNFTSCEGDGHTVFRLGFRSSLYNGSNGQLSPSIIRTVHNDLKENTKVISLLLRTFEDLRVTQLEPSSADPIYCTNFLTFWHNGSISYLNKITSKLSFTRYIDGRERNFPYYIFGNDELDGAFYACSSVYFQTDSGKPGVMQPGLWSPFTNSAYLNGVSDDLRSSLLCYNSDRDVLCAPRSNRTCSQSGVFHSVYFNSDSSSGWTGSECVSPNARKVQVNSLSNLSQSVTQTVLFIMKTDN